MQPEKVYKSLIYLIYNIIKNEKLRFEIFNDRVFKEKLIKQVNNLLVLEKDFNQQYNGRQWAETFGKAIVKITNEKQRFEKFDNLTVDQIYADYSSFVSYSSSQFAVGRNLLTEELVNFTEQDVLIDATLTESVKEKYRELAREEEQLNQEANAQKQADQTVVSEESKATTQETKQQSNHHTRSRFNFENINSPLKDPRFYPYTTKPKWMPILKRSFAIVMIVSFTLVIVSAIVFSTLRVNLQIDNNIFGKALFGNQWLAEPINGDWNKVLSKRLSEKGIKFPKTIPVIGGFDQVFPFIFYGLVIGWSCWLLLKKPKTLTEKYRISPFISIFSLLILAMGIYSIASSYLMKSQITSSYLQYLLTFIADNYLDQIDKSAFQTTMLDYYGGKIDAIVVLAILGMAFSGVALVFGIVLTVLNPRRDMQKFARGTMEAQRQAMLMVQGQEYVADESIFDSEEINVLNQSPCKVKEWFKKIFKKRDRNKNKGIDSKK